jgi:hypothetical protein
MSADSRSSNAFTATTSSDRVVDKRVGTIFFKKGFGTVINIFEKQKEFVVGWNLASELIQSLIQIPSYSGF